MACTEEREKKRVKRSMVGRKAEKMQKTKRDKSDAATFLSSFVTT